MLEAEREKSLILKKHSDLNSKDYLLSEIRNN